jgi:hypothetical protein
MTPRQVSTYKPPRNRRELAVAVLGVVVVLAFTVGMLFLLAPDDETITPVPTPVPSSLPTDTSLPTDSTLPLPSGDSATTPTSVPAG